MSLVYYYYRHLSRVNLTLFIKKAKYFCRAPPDCLLAVYLFVSRVRVCVRIYVLCKENTMIFEKTCLIAKNRLKNGYSYLGNLKGGVLSSKSHLLVYSAFC
jgi:hypothetical protein